MNIILVGPPGAGKGTLADVLCTRLNIPTISTGNILREAIKNDTALGKIAKGFMDEGQLVPDELVINMISERIAQSDCQNGFILDGFPRNIEQAEALDDITNIDVALCLECNDSVIVERMTGRRTCPECGATYHVRNNPPKIKHTCDKCKQTLIIRSDDEQSVVLDRLGTYHMKTKPLKYYYRGQRKLRTVDASIGIEETLASALKVLGQ